MEKIDFVIIWVDGNDKKWQDERKQYDSNKSDNREIRYREWDNLKYWFRGVEKYASWVNKIYFVTCGQKPEWLNENNPKLKLINHDEFIPKEYLPTFSSHPIELNLHRIPELSEKFVYFNDDMFVVNKVKESDFFINDLPCDSAILSPAIQEDKFGIGNVELNNMAIINTYFDKNKQIKAKRSNWFNHKYEFKQKLKNYLLNPWNSFPSFYEFHIPSSFLKSTYEKIWELEQSELDEVCRHKFRNLKLDVNQWLIRDWQLASNKFIPRSTKTGKLFTLDKNSNVKDIFNNKYKLICINDSDDIDEKMFNKFKKSIIEEFEKKLPEKSSFEK